MKHQWIAKIALFIMWPPLAVLLLALIALPMIAAWLLIPFGQIRRKDDNSNYEMTFPWRDA